MIVEELQVVPPCQEEIGLWRYAAKIFEGPYRVRYLYIPILISVTMR